MEEFVPGIGHSEFHNQTTVHPVGLAMLMLLGLAMVTLPRRRAMIPFLMCTSFIAVGQRLVVFGLDFNFLRVMVLFGWTRILLRQEFQAFRWKRLDSWVVAWAIAGTLAYPISHGASSIVYKLGTSFDSLGMYFIVRMLVRNLDDVRDLIDAIAIISIPVACCFAVEFCTSRNPFAFMGGVQEITVQREGRLRCQGAYSHAILAGCFWAAVIPLLVGRICSPGFRGRFGALVGLFASLAIIRMCASSTPIVGVLAAGVGFALLPLRGSMKWVRWTTVAALLCLQMMMKNPVWHLISRADFVGGSTGWHRFHLIEQFINHFQEWAAFGVADITHWGVWANDVTNQYILDGVRGGVITLTLFLIMIGVAFGNVGRLWRSIPRSRPHVILAWSLGVSLFVHAVNFVGVAYFGQIDILWYIGLAVTATAPVGMNRGRVTEIVSVSDRHARASGRYIRTRV